MGQDANCALPHKVANRAGSCARAVFFLLDAGPQLMATASVRAP